MNTDLADTGGDKITCANWNCWCSPIGCVESFPWAVLHLDPTHRTGAVLVEKWLREPLCILKYPRENILIRHVCHIGDAVSAGVVFEFGFGDSDAIH